MATKAAADADNHQALRKKQEAKDTGRPPVRDTKEAPSGDPQYGMERPPPPFDGKKGSP